MLKRWQERVDAVAPGLTVSHVWVGEAEHHVCVRDAKNRRLTLVFDEAGTEYMLDYSGWQQETP